MTADHTLFGNAKSPFVRKAMAFAHAAGVADRLTVSPPPAGATYAENPLGKIPAMALPSGETIVESELIVAELDALAGGSSLMPADRAGRRRRALASGALDCAVSRLYETRRPADKIWDDWMVKQKAKIDATLDALEGEADALTQTADAETTTVGSLLGYLDFRFPQDEWRATRPKLAAWWADFEKTPCMAATTPSDD